MTGVSQGGGRAFFDGSSLVGFCRMDMRFMAAASCQRYRVALYGDKKNGGFDL